MIVPWWLDFFFLKMQFASKSSNASLIKYYPNQKMANIIEYCDSLYEIPDSWMKKLLPNKDMPIDTFISCKLPSSKSTLIDISAHSCFLPKIPSENPESLLARSIPSKQFILDAKLTFNQCILDGCCSVCDSNYKGKPLPLWSIEIGRAHV